MGSFINFFYSAFLIFLLSPAFCVGEESNDFSNSFDFKSDKLGMLFEDFRKKYPYSDDKVSSRCFADDSNSYPMHCFLEGRANTVAGVESDINYYFSNVKNENEVNLRLSKISLTFKQEDFKVVNGVLIHKYGEPKKRSSQIMQNAMGAKFNRVVLKWKNNYSRIILREYESNLLKSILIYELFAAKEAILKKQKEEIKSRFEDL